MNNPPEVMFPIAAGVMFVSLILALNPRQEGSNLRDFLKGLVRSFAKIVCVVGRSYWSVIGNRATLVIYLVATCLLALIVFVVVLGTPSYYGHIASLVTEVALTLSVVLMLVSSTSEVVLRRAFRALNYEKVNDKLITLFIGLFVMEMYILMGYAYVKNPVIVKWLLVCTIPIGLLAVWGMSVTIMRPINGADISKLEAPQALVAALGLLLLWEPALILLFSDMIAGIAWLNANAYHGLWMDAKNPIGFVGNSVYFTTVSFTTLGYGDIYPLTGAAKTVSMIVAVVGHIFSFGIAAVLIATVMPQNKAPQGSPQDLMKDS